MLFSIKAFSLIFDELVSSRYHGNYSAPVGVRSIVINTRLAICLWVCVCPSVCLSVREHISGIAGPTKFCVQIQCSRGSILLWRRCATLCTSGFMDDVMFGRNGRDAETWRLHRAATAMSGVAIPGRSLMSMNACWVLWGAIIIYFY